MTDKKFYIIARTAQVTGIGALIFGLTSHILYAISKGFIPIVDLKHYKNQYFKDGRTYKDNSWEYFLEQPLGYSVDDIPDDAECIISENKLHKEGPYDITPESIPICPETGGNCNINTLKTEFKKYIRFNKQAKEYFENEYNNIVNPEYVMLGVLARGTDFLVKRSHGETIQPKPEAIIKKIRHFMDKHKDINKIYLATEDQKLLEIFKAEFGDLLIYNNQYRYEYNNPSLPYLSEIKVPRENHNFQLALEYLSSLNILSKCRYFVGGRCGGSIVAWLLSEKWDDFYIWNLGRYGQYLDFLKNIFEMKNRYDETNNKYKEITLLGYKFNIRCKNPRSK